MKKKVVLAVLLGVLALQLWPAPWPDNPPVESEPPWPPEVAAIMRRACFDCHSNQTEWPWISYVAPPRWFLVDGVTRSRGALNFSTWKRYRPNVRRRVMERTVTQALHGPMAPEIYKKAHPEARLSPEDRQVLTSWLAGYREEIRPLAAPNWELFRLPAREGGTVLGPGSWVSPGGDLELDRALVRVEQGEVGAVRGTGVLVAFPGVAVRGPVDPGVAVIGKDFVRLQLPDLSQRRLSFCRDDGELPEPNERTLLVYYGHGQFLLLEPELEVGRFALGVEGAMQAVESLLAQDPTTDLNLWRRRFRPAWRGVLESMTSDRAGAMLEAHPEERGPR